MGAESDVRVRPATHADRDAISSLSGFAHRRDAVLEAVDSGRCLVAELTSQPVGIAVTNRFFGYDFVELLYVTEQARRRGVGSALVRHVESIAATSKLFTSTNESNVAMRRLCEQLGFVESGRIENLDEVDPELVYCKLLGEHPERPT